MNVRGAELAWGARVGLVASCGLPCAASAFAVRPWTCASLRAGDSCLHSSASGVVPGLLLGSLSLFLLLASFLAGGLRPGNLPTHPDREHRNLLGSQVRAGSFLFSSCGADSRGWTSRTWTVWTASGPRPARPQGALGLRTAARRVNTRRVVLGLHTAADDSRDRARRRVLAQPLGGLSSRAAMASTTRTLAQSRACGTGWIRRRERSDSLRRIDSPGQRPAQARGVFCGGAAFVAQHPPPARRMQAIGAGDIEVRFCFFFWCSGGALIFLGGIAWRRRSRRCGSSTSGPARLGFVRQDSTGRDSARD